MKKKSSQTKRKRGKKENENAPWSIRWHVFGYPMDPILNFLLVSFRRSFNSAFFPVFFLFLLLHFVLLVVCMQFYTIYGHEIQDKIGSMCKNYVKMWKPFTHLIICLASIRYNFFLCRF